ncbi:helix-turn-helix domain-containing protein [Vibrio astriarenae]|uniref:Helix-turn-helix domain-containing protein n=1 Tax=Vibrio astriarenae TaxID=1481923 RepID=A0A7Z2T2B3_9VIBR|nr:helix-turn-helix transcriptional regulator [Vibrio astriarenae]QIA63073.1 helix-turn-helix domain-containing protein [Vibrio astriarenae]
MSSPSAMNELQLSSTTHLTHVIEYCNELGIQWEEIAEQCFLPVDIENNREWVRSDNLLQFVAILERRVNRNIGLDIGRRATSSFQTFFRQNLVGITSIEEALKTLLKIMPKMNNHLSIWLEQIEGEYWLCHRKSRNPSSPGYAQIEWYNIFLFCTFLRAFYGHTWSPRKIKVMSIYHADAAYKYFPRSNIDFECDFSAIKVDDLTTTEGIHRVTTSGDIKQGITKLVTSYATLPWFTIEWFAKIMCTTPRTLQRYLRSQNLSFKQLKEQTRKECAIDLITNTSMPIHDIAWRSGYNDLSNFNRAFKAWTGESPSSFRATSKDSKAILDSLRC